MTIQQYLVVIPACIGAFFFTICGFGSAILFVFIWFVFEQANLLDLTTEMKDFVFMICIMNLLAAGSILVQKWREVTPKIAAFLSFFGVVGCICGIETLRAVGGSVWLKRSLGLLIGIALIVNLCVSTSGEPQDFLMKKVNLCVIIACGCTCSGFLGGLAGIFGPPLMLTLLSMNINKNSYLPNHAVFMLSFNFIQLLYNLFIWESADSDYVVAYLFVLLGAFIGVVGGNLVLPYVTQDIFVLLLRSILFIAAITIGTHKFSFSFACMITSFIILFFAVCYIYWDVIIIVLVWPTVKEKWMNEISSLVEQQDQNSLRKITDPHPVRVEDEEQLHDSKEMEMANVNLPIGSSEEPDVNHRDECLFNV